MFPGAGAVIYRNEVGEPIGWDYPDAYEPDPGDPYDAYDEGPDGPFEGCCDKGDWDARRTREGRLVWECSYCDEPIPWEKVMSTGPRYSLPTDRIRKYRERAIRRGTLRLA